MSKQWVLTSNKNQVTTVTMNRPEALNALSEALRQELIEIFTDLATDPKTDVVILTGTGRAFTVGLDLKELSDDDPGKAVTSTDLTDAMVNLNKPMIGAINGFAITGGFEIALMSDFLIAGPEAKFADTHTRVGIVPGWGLSQKLPRLIGLYRAKELSLTGNFLDADTAYAWGLVNRVVDNDELLPLCQSLGEDIASTDAVTRKTMRQIIDQGWSTTLEAGLAIEKEANRAHADAELRAEGVADKREQVRKRGQSQSDD